MIIITLLSASNLTITFVHVTITGHCRSLCLFCIRGCVVFVFIVFVCAFVLVFVIVPILLRLCFALVRAASVFVLGYESCIVFVVRGSWSVSVFVHGRDRDSDCAAKLCF